MLRSLAVLSAVLCASAQSYTCPTYIRAAHGFNAAPGVVAPLDFYVNGQLVTGNIPFRAVSNYVSISAGRTSIAIRPAGSLPSTTPLSESTFMAVSGQAYTIGWTGAVTGPAGQVVSSTSPFVNPDVRVVPNPGRFYGLWYRWSETNLNIDFRTVSGTPDLPWGVGNASDVERLSNLSPKTVIPIGEMPFGTYSFYPTLLNSNAPLFNAQRNEYVQVRGINVVSREFVDVFALGDTLLAAHTNNLALTTTRTTANFDPTTGCTLMAGAGGAPRLTSSAVTVGASAAAMLAIAAAGTMLL